MAFFPNLQLHRIDVRIEKLTVAGHPARFDEGEHGWF
jgi:hypothetical protein